MSPHLTDPLPVYYAMWLVATVVCTVFGDTLSRRDGQPRAKSILLGVFLFAAILIGSKLMYLLEAALFPPRPWQASNSYSRIAKQGNQDYPAWNAEPMRGRPQDTRDVVILRECQSFDDVEDLGASNYEPKQYDADDDSPSEGRSLAQGKGHP